ncbi:MAG: hypothetical protein RIM84_21110 [Alphaproteobacteria bacterium]
MTFKKTATKAWLGTAFCLLAGPALAQEAVPIDKAAHCLPHDILVSYLDEAFEESRIATAALDEGQPVELFASRRGTWTLIEVHSDGLGCINAYGERFKLDRTLGQAALPAGLG